MFALSKQQRIRNQFFNTHRGGAIHVGHPQNFLISLPLSDTESIPQTSHLGLPPPPSADVICECSSIRYAPHLGGEGCVFGGCELDAELLSAARQVLDAHEDVLVDELGELAPVRHAVALPVDDAHLIDGGGRI